MEEGRVNIDYHVDYDLRVYSVPHGLVGDQTPRRSFATIIKDRPHPEQGYRSCLALTATRRNSARSEPAGLHERPEDRQPDAQDRRSDPAQQP
jgi:hypothetical protein